MLPIRYGEQPALNRSDVKLFRIVECHLCPEFYLQKKCKRRKIQKRPQTKVILFLFFFGLKSQLNYFVIVGMVRSTERDENNNLLASHRHTAVTMRMSESLTPTSTYAAEMRVRRVGMWSLPTGKSRIENSFEWFSALAKAGRCNAARNLMVEAPFMVLLGTRSLTTTTTTSHRNAIIWP